MPTPSHAAHAALGARVSRRAALLGLAAASAALTGCTPHGVKREENPEPVEPEIDPDVAIATEALAQQQAMIAFAGAVQARHRRLAPRLAELLAAHQAHADLLAEAAPDQPTPSSPSSPSSPSAAPSATTIPGPGRVPRRPAPAVRALAVAEQELATATKQHAFNARSGAFARVLGSMAAAAAQQAAMLSSDAEGPS